MDIIVLCEACGTELKTPDVTCDPLLRVVIKATPCHKCSRPPDCHLTCEDVLKLKKERREIITQILPPILPPNIRECFGTSKNTDECKSCVYLKVCAAVEEEGISIRPNCFGNYDDDEYDDGYEYDCTGSCIWRVACMNFKPKKIAGTSQQVVCPQGLTSQNNDCLNCSLQLKCKVHK